MRWDEFFAGRLEVAIRSEDEARTMYSLIRSKCDEYGLVRVTPYPIGDVRYEDADTNSSAGLSAVILYANEPAYYRLAWFYGQRWGIHNHSEVEDNVTLEEFVCGLHDSECVACVTRDVSDDDLLDFIGGV